MPQREQEALDREVYSREKAGAPKVHGKSIAPRTVQHAAARCSVCRELGRRISFHRHYEVSIVILT